MIVIYHHIQLLLEIGLANFSFSLASNQIILISTSLVARISSVNHWHPALELFNKPLEIRQ
jgi:hypothetical protein